MNTTTLIASCQNVSWCISTAVSSDTWWSSILGDSKVLASCRVTWTPRLLPVSATGGRVPPNCHPACSGACTGVFPHTHVLHPITSYSVSALPPLPQGNRNTNEYTPLRVTSCSHSFQGGQLRTGAQLLTEGLISGSWKGLHR